MIEDDFAFPIEKQRTRPKVKPRSSWSRLRIETHEGFRCAHCHAYVSAESLRSGVVNRNHCPYCLWSRHVDLYQAGDRMAACKEKMRPVGLTLKKTLKKYGRQSGELMIIHQCIDCGKISINRVAADDDAETVLHIFERSLELDLQTRASLDASAVDALQFADRDVVSAHLFGRG